MPGREVVITGIGLVTSLGKDIGENWTGLKEEKTGINRYPVEGLPACYQHMGKVGEYELPSDIPPRQRGQMKFLNRGAVLGLCASHEALAQCRESVKGISPARRALYIASGDFTNVGYEFMYPAVRESADPSWETADQQKLNTAMLNRVNPFFLLESLTNNLFSFLSAYGEFMGPNTSLASLSPYGGNALELACRCIRQGTADMALAVGYGSWITEIALYELEGLGILSQCKSGTRSFRPFDRERDGFIPGEGGAAIVVQAADTLRDDVRPFGFVRGFGNGIEFSESHGFSVPGKVSVRTVQSALKETDCAPRDLLCIIAHGSGTKKGDRSELKSFADALGEASNDVPVCGLKPYTGHMGAASDLGEIIFGLLAAREGLVPATLNFRRAEKEFSGMKLSGSHQSRDRNRFLSVSYGVGGQSSSVLIEADRS